MLFDLVSLRNGRVWFDSRFKILNPYPPGADAPGYPCFFDSEVANHGDDRLVVCVGEAKLTDQSPSEYGYLHYIHYTSYTDLKSSIITSE